MDLGLVLGGGGVVGVAWELGVLAGLAEETGWDPASVRTVVGTSAGAVNGTQLRQGRSLDDLVERQRAGGDRLADGAASSPPDPSAAMEVFRLWASAEEMDPPTAQKVAELATVASGIAEEDWVAGFAAMLESEWPHGDLRITGVSVATGERVVWTSQSSVPLVLAVAASCAVPGLFPPVTVGDGLYVDGGLWSGSNTDVLAGEPLDAVLFVGPMGSGATGIGGLSARMLDRERRAFAAAGVNLHTVEPGEAFRRAGLQLMDAARRVEALEIGLAEGRDAAGALAAVLSPG